MTTGYNDYSQEYEREQEARLEAGKVVRMWNKSRGWQYVRNVPAEIKRMFACEFFTEEEATKAGVEIGPCGSQRGIDVDLKPHEPERPGIGAAQAKPAAKKKASAKAAKPEDGE